MAMTWYLRAIGGNVNNPAHYSNVGQTPPSCPGTGTICALYGEIGTGGVIILNDEELTEQRLEALNTGFDQPRVLLREQN